MRHGGFLVHMAGAVAAVLLCVAAGPAAGQEKAPSVGNLFIQAYLDKNEAAMKELITTRTAEFPGEVQAMVEYAISPGVTQEDQDFIFNVAGNIAQMYGKHTGDERLLDAVRSNYENVLKKRAASALPPEGIEAAKKELMALGNGNWRVNVFKLDDNGDLLVEIDVKESASGAGFTPHIGFKQSQKAKEIVKKHIPGVKKGKISWSSMGVGLKAAFLE